MDELERHIVKARDKMDIHDPDPGIWQRIAADLARGEKRLGSYLWRAAVVLIIVGAGLVTIVNITRALEKRTDPRMMAVHETYLYYNNQITSLYEEAEPLLTTNPEISHLLQAGMNELDSLSMQIRDDLNDNIASEEVVKALIANYRLRIELLEDMLMLMRKQEAETTKNANHEL